MHVFKILILELSIQEKIKQIAIVIKPLKVSSHEFLI